MAVGRAEVNAWLRAYVEAWKTYDPGQIEALFAENVRYRFHPYDEPVVGREAVVAAWLGESEAEGASTRDEPNTYDAEYSMLAIDGNLAIAVGATTYLAHAGGPVDRVYDNCYFIRFDDDSRCVEFTEWFMQRPKR